MASRSGKEEKAEDQHQGAHEGDHADASAQSGGDKTESEARAEQADAIEAQGGGNTEVIEPTPPGQNPTTLGQQMEVTPDRGGQQKVSQETGTGVDYGEPNDVRPAVVVGENGRLQQVKQIKTR